MFRKTKRINHVRRLAEARGLTRLEFIREAMYHCRLARNTAKDAWDGKTEMSLDTVEQLAVYFGVSKEQILETVM